MADPLTDQCGILHACTCPDRHHISQGSEFERRIGYSRAIVDGRWVFVAGTTGFDYSTMTIADDVVAQVEQTLRNIDDALRGPARVLPTSSG